MLVRHKYEIRHIPLLCLARMCPGEWMTDWEWSERQIPTFCERQAPEFRTDQCQYTASRKPAALDSTALAHRMKRKGSPPPVDVDGSPKRARKGKENDEFCSVKASIVLSVPPVFANRLRCGVEEMLDTLIMRYAHTHLLPHIFFLTPRRYEPTLNGVVLAHSNVHFLDRVAQLQADSPFAICHVGFDALIWKPTCGMKLSAYVYSLRIPPRPFLPQLLGYVTPLAGRVTLCSPDHVSLLLHRTFNVSIPRHHIPEDQWEFEYGPAENDPEFGNLDDDYMDVDAREDAQEADDDAQATTYQRGRWVHKITGDRLGGKDRWLHFTVVG